MNEKNQKPKKLLDLVREKIRLNHYSIRTERSYVNWIYRFILFHKKKHPKEMGEKEIEAFLTHLAVNKKVAASTQNQAFNALLFLYRKVLEIRLKDEINATRAKRPKKIPVVMTPEETRSVISALQGQSKLIAQILYGGGLRLMEVLRLRIHDIDFSANEITVRSGKGNKDRLTILPQSIEETLNEHIRRVKMLHEKDLREGYGSVYLPNAYLRKSKNAANSWQWQYVFPAKSLSKDPWSGEIRRHHIDATSFHKALKNAIGLSGIIKHVTSHTFRHSFATHLLQNGYDIRTIQELLGHEDVATTMIYTHVLRQGARGVKSPLDE